MNTETPPLSDSTAAIGLYKYDCPCPSSDSFEEFYEIASDLLSECGTAITYIGVDGPGYSDKFQPIGGRSHGKLVKSHFAGIVDLSLVANPIGSDSPAYDSFANCSLSHSNVTGECLIVVAINEALLPFKSSAYERLLKRLTNFHDWDFGFGFRAPVSSKPDFYILGLDDGQRSPAEYKSLSAWYDAPPSERVRKLRDVHPYNIVNAAQLAQPVGNATLREFAEQHGSLKPLAQEGLFLWQVEESALPDIRSRLAGSEAIIR